MVEVHRVIRWRSRVKLIPTFMNAVFCLFFVLCERFLVDDHGPIRRGSEGAIAALLDDAWRL